MLESIRIISIYLYPFIPKTSQSIYAQLGLTADIKKANLDNDTKWGLLKPGTKIKKEKPLFPRIET